MREIAQTVFWMPERYVETFGFLSPVWVPILFVIWAALTRRFTAKFVVALLAAEALALLGAWNVIDRWAAV